MGLLKFKKNKNVITLTFENESQAKKLLEVFDDSNKAIDTRESLNAIMEYCDIDSVRTYEEA